MTVKSQAVLKSQFKGTDPYDQNADVVDSLGASASATAAGLVELATDAETQTGTATDRAVTPANLTARTATTTRTGVVELATDAEAITGADTARAITPANLAAAATTHVAAASATVAGKVELAIDAEAKAGSDSTRALTPANLAAVLAAVKVATFAGHNGAGACTLTGAVAGDVVIGVAGLTDMGIADGSFEAAITVNDQIQQSSGVDLSLKNFIALLKPVA